MALPVDSALPVLRGTCYDGASSRALEVDASLQPEGSLLIAGPGFDRSFAWNDCRVSEPLGRMSRIIELPGGGRIETGDLEVLAQWEQATGRGGGLRLVHRLESRRRWILAAFVILGLAVFSAWRWGIPTAAKLIARRTPPSVEQSLTSQTRKALEILLKLDESKLPRERRDSLEARFKTLAAAMDPSGAHDYRLVFYKSKALGANAFALPDGLVLVTDGLVKKAKNDDQILAVLAHEATHVRERHGLRLVLQDSSVFLLWSLLTGDVVSSTTAAIALPSVLAQRGYSRLFEREADLGAARYLRSLGRDTAPLRDMLRLIDPESTETSDPTGENALDQSSNMLSTHPLTEERIRLLEQFDRDATR